MPYDASNLICVAGNSQASHWAYRTTDHPGEVLAPGYFPDDRMQNFMHPGEILTLTCLPAVGPNPSRSEPRPQPRPELQPRRDSNPIAVLQAVTARTPNGVWLVLPLTPVIRPAHSVTAAAARKSD